MSRPITRTLCVIALAACGSDHVSHPPPTGAVADIAADSNRDGEVRFDGSDAVKMDWTEEVGAVFLANIDDDSRRCKTVDNDLTIALCNDAQDDVVNGADDALDLARLRTRATTEPADATGKIDVLPEAAKPHVRLFVRSGPADADFTLVDDATVFTHDQLEKGLELGIEATDIVRDRAVWDGYADIQLTVSSSEGTATDTVRMRVAPVLTFHHLLDAQAVWLPKPLNSGRRATRDDVATSSKQAGLDAPLEIDVVDQWAQDYFEPGFMSMPGMSGTQHVILVNYRSANVFDPTMTKAPLRPAGRIVFELRGRDVAGVQQYDVEHDRKMDGLNSFGNLETIPPYEKDGVSFPFGRVLRGATSSFFPDRAFTKMVDAQGQQPEVDIDTSWLLVGHVDETLSFVKAPTPRGWMLLANDARLAKKMLDDAVAAGHGDVQMFVGKTSIEDEDKPADITIADVLADSQVMQASAEAAAEVDGQLEVLKRETGLTDDEIIHVPYLHTIHDGKSIAYQPGTVNGLYLASNRFAAPDPHGPVIDGKDMFKEALSVPLAKIGITVDWVEDWDAYHRNFGEVHCASNTSRQIPTARWWESGR